MKEPALLELSPDEAISIMRNMSTCMERELAVAPPVCKLELRRLMRVFSMNSRKCSSLSSSSSTKPRAHSDSKKRCTSGSAQST